MIRTRTERKAPGKAQERNNEKEPYNVPTTEPQRRRLKKEPKNKHPTNKAAPPNAKKNRTIKNNGCDDKAGKKHLKKHTEQMKEQNLVLTETEPQRRGPTHKGANLSTNRNRTTKQRTQSWAWL